MNKKTTSRRKTARTAKGTRTRAKGGPSGKSRAGKAAGTGRRYELLGLALLAAGLLSICGILGSTSVLWDFILPNSCVISLAWEPLSSLS